MRLSVNKLRQETRLSRGNRESLAGHSIALSRCQVITRYFIQMERSSGHLFHLLPSSLR